MCGVAKHKAAYLRKHLQLIVVGEHISMSNAVQQVPQQLVLHVARVLLS